jgi:hypothetical protein
MTRRLVTSLFLAALAIGVAAPGSATARIRCGATITKDTTLHHSLHCKRRTPIKIGAGHLILDLNGHEVERGWRRRHPSRTGAAIINRGHDRVNITNGKVTSHGGHAILVKDADANHLVRTKVTATGGRGVVVLVDTTHTTVRDNESEEKAGRSC